MACSNPIKLYQENIKPSIRNNHANFKNIALKRSFGHHDYIEVPCRCCLNCRIDKQNELVDRCEYEYINYGCGAFVTFTYDDVHLFDNSFIDSHSGQTIASINKKQAKEFLDRLNKLVHKESDRLKKLGVENKLCRPDYKYVLTQEYGDSFNRPHIHCLFFGLDFAYCERLFWRAWNYKGSIQVGSIKNGGIAYCVKYISNQTFGIDKFYKYNYHHLTAPYSTHSLKLGEGLYKFQLSFIKKTGCYKWHNKDRPVPSYYKNKYNVISDIEEKQYAKNYKVKCESIKNLYDVDIDSFEKFTDFNHNLALTRERNIRCQLHNRGERVLDNEQLAIEKNRMIHNFSNRLDTCHDKAITKVINNQGIEYLNYKKRLIKLPLTEVSSHFYFGLGFNDFSKRIGIESAQALFGSNYIPF